MKTHLLYHKRISYQLILPKRKGDTSQYFLEGRRKVAQSDKYSDSRGKQNADNYIHMY